MPADKGKVRAKLDEILKGTSATKNFKDGYATRWASKIETDEDIEEFVNDRKDDLIEATKEGDRRATSSAEQAKKDALDALQGKKEEKKEEQPGPDDGAPAWAKALFDQNKAFTEKFAAMEQSTKTQTIAEKYKSDPRVKDIPDFIRKGYTPTSEDDFEANVTSLTEAWTTFATESKLASFGNDKPVGVGGITTTASGKVDPDIVAFAEKQVASTTKN